MAFTKVQSVTLSMVVGVIISVGILSLADTASARPATPVSMADPIPFERSNPVLERLAGRFSRQYPSPNAQVATQAEIQQAHDLYRQNALGGGRDYANAALVLGNSPDKEDVLLASELSIAALALGNKHASKLAAWTHDRYLVMSGETQRFGTLRDPRNKSVLLPVESGVTDTHRRSLGLVSLTDAKKPQPKFAAAEVVQTAPLTE